jgi:hypothetical protein
LPTACSPRALQADACAAAQLDRKDLLAAILRKDPSRVNERGGDGQTPLHFARSREVVDLLLACRRRSGCQRSRSPFDARGVDDRRPD